MGHYRGFIAFLKVASPHVFTIDCVIHRYHLVAKNKSGCLNLSFKTVIKAVNKIKVHALNTRLFKQLCYENDEAFERLLLHSEARWLSKGNCLARCNSLLDTVVEFQQSCDPGLAKVAIAVKNDIAYLSDIFSKLNELCLQGNEVNLIKVKSALSGFKKKFGLQRNLYPSKMILNSNQNSVISYQSFWLQSEIEVKYPPAWDRVIFFHCIFQLILSRACVQYRCSASG